MNKTLAELILISNKVGKDVRLVQGGGGNTSAKTDDCKYMYIKASGTALKDMSEQKGWRRMRLDAVLDVVTDNTLAAKDAAKRETEVVSRLLSACDDDATNSSHPSVEAHLHGILDKFVIHLHPQVVGSFVNAKNGQKQIEKIFKNEKFPPLWVPYVDPGYMLGKRIARLVGKYKQQHRRLPQIVFLDKHGLFVSANSANTALHITDRVIEICADNIMQIRSAKLNLPDGETIKDIKLAIRKAVFKTSGKQVMVGYFFNATVASFLKRNDAAKLLASPALTPDELVYANGSPVWINNLDADAIAAKIIKQAQKEGKAPASFVVLGAGLFTTGTMKNISVVADIVTSSLFVRMQAARMGGIRALNKRERDFINNWESEAFRKTMAQVTCGWELQDKIAVVTGAGSGLGRHIALGLAKAGAAVCIADIDETAAKETVQIIEAQVPGVSMIVPCNVTSKESVAAGFESIVNNFGGLDILVNAAGVAPAYSLTDLPVEKWRFALDVNLTGYFLMAQAAAKVMIKQDMGGSIINISSKSGIDASKNNTAYNATKAGELHMARGWAMELGEHNIRVNSVCPGNVFEGSKIWNPKYIKVCAKKYGIKPDEVIPYYVNKTILKKEIKGQDIAEAVVFLSSEKSRMVTGQTLVIDAGQVMVR